MRIYTKVIVDIATGKQLYEDSYEYEGEVAECGGGSKKAGKPSAYYPYSVDIVKGIPELGGAIRQDIITNPFMDYGSQQYKQAVSDIRGGYGARGLEGSGIALKGEQDALQKIATQIQAQRAGQLGEILKSVSGAPNVATPPAQQPRGFMGMK